MNEHKDFVFVNGFRLVSSALKKINEVIIAIYKQRISIEQNLKINSRHLFYLFLMSVLLKPKGSLII